MNTIIARSRADDPASSREAAEQMNDSGAASHQLQKAVNAVRRHPGLTSAELADAVGMDRYAMARRLPDAERVGKVVRGRFRICRVTGRKSLTWAPVVVEPGRAG